MLVFQTNPVGVKLFSYVNTFFCFTKLICIDASHIGKKALLILFLFTVFCVTSLRGLYLEGLMHGEAYFQNFTVLGYYCYCVNPPKCVII